MWPTRRRLDLAVSLAGLQYTNGTVKVFDILYLNDRCITGARLSERKRLLRSDRIFKNIDDYKGRIEFVDEERGKSGKDIRAMLERILEAK